MMKLDVIERIAELVKRSTPDLPSRLEYQAEGLHEAKCLNPLVGRWIDEHGVNYLLSVFALDDKDFADSLPALAHVTEHDRKRIVATFEGHLEQCHHCSLKRGYELELDSRIERACRQDKDSLLQLLEDGEAETSEEGEHRDVKVFSAHQ